ncbi:hypothetical protein P8452_46335 [Trifolium repens]|nr:hypothetical protein P8452_46335 [Trifolium repens]
MLDNIISESLLVPESQLNSHHNHFSIQNHFVGIASSRISIVTSSKSLRRNRFLDLTSSLLRQNRFLTSSQNHILIHSESLALSVKVVLLMIAISIVSSYDDGATAQIT